MGAIAEDFKAMTDTPEKPKHKTWKERLRDARDRIESPKVDFAPVPPSQWAMHDRLENWAKWCYGRTARDSDTSPMFTLHRSDAWEDREYGAATVVPINKFDAADIAEGVAVLPEKHRKAIQWRYLMDCKNPKGKAQELAVSLQGLADLVRDARQILINRGV